MRPLLIAILLTTTLPAAAEPATITPAQIGQIWCIAVLGNDMAAIGGLLIDDFTAAIEQAQASSDAWAKGHPGEKPPLGDGLPWTEYPDYADGCTPGRPVTEDGAQAEVAINYSFSAELVANYTNSLRLEKDQIDGLTRWRIVDVGYSADGGTMRQWLLDVDTTQ